MTTDPVIELSELMGFHEVEAAVAGRPLFHFNWVQSFRYSSCEGELGDAWGEVELVMKELEPPHSQIGFRFHRVSVQSFSGFGQIMGLCFWNIRGRGWEGHRFEVGDYEDGHIHLFCDEISIFMPGKGD
jgi:hypothetical protein